jgi:hypothetical protein
MHRLINKCLTKLSQALLFVKPGQTEVFLIAAKKQQGRKELTQWVNSQGRLRWITFSFGNKPIRIRTSLTYTKLYQHISTGSVQLHFVSYVPLSNVTRYLDIQSYTKLYQHISTGSVQLHFVSYVPLSNVTRYLDIQYRSLTRNHTSLETNRFIG